MSIRDDVFASRGHARAAAAHLRRQGFDARVEQSGPQGAREYRVITFHPVDDAVAYFWADDRLDDYVPHWI